MKGKVCTFHADGSHHQCLFDKGLFSTESKQPLTEPPDNGKLNDKNKGLETEPDLGELWRLIQSGHVDIGNTAQVEILRGIVVGRNAKVNQVVFGGNRS